MIVSSLCAHPSKGTSPRGAKWAHVKLPKLRAFPNLLCCSSHSCTGRILLTSDLSLKACRASEDGFCISKLYLILFSHQQAWGAGGRRGRNGVIDMVMGVEQDERNKIGHFYRFFLFEGKTCWQNMTSHSMSGTLRPIKPMREIKRRSNGFSKCTFSSCCDEL